MAMLPGAATAEGTAAMAAARSDLMAVRAHRAAFGLTLSSLGAGTYLGAVDRGRDAGYAAALQQALRGGINVVDTAINYRNQRSERVVGEVLAGLVEAGDLDRSGVFVSTKGGYIPFDADVADPRRDIHEQYVAPGLISERNVVSGVHCMDAPYLRDQIARSRRNLGLETIDLYYLHNPETQLAAVDRETFRSRLVTAFQVFEEAVDAGHIARYGVATWSGLREPFEAPGHLALTEIVAAAEAARAAMGGGPHHFEAVQAPLNLAMPEAVTRPTQRLADGRVVPLADACTVLGLTFFTSASILQGRLAQGLRDDWRDAVGAVGTDAQVALQATRSAPGVTSALVGLASAPHVDEALGLLRAHAPDAARVWTLRGRPAV